MEKMRSRELFLEKEGSLAYDFVQSYMYPWECLPHIKEFILEIGKALPNEEYDRWGENIWVSPYATVSKTAHIGEYTIICKGAEVRHCAFIRGCAVVGRGTVVGNSTELKNCILFDNCQVPHYNYVGDSILGKGAHMGAGSITSNVKGDRSVIKMGNKIDTGLKKMGAFLGDFVEIGCGSVLNPGTVIGRKSRIYPLCSVRGYVPPNHIYKGDDNIIPINSI